MNYSNHPPRLRRILYSIYADNIKIILLSALIGHLLNIPKQNLLISILPLISLVILNPYIFIEYFI